MIKKALIKIIGKSSVYGSMSAAYKAFNDFLFNLKATLLHLKNFRSKKIKCFKRLHFGCGSDIKKGFLNIDISDAADVFLDARNKLPFENETIKFIYSSHFVEHLEHHELMNHFRECNRILSGGGILRLAVPNFPDSMRAYLEKDMERLEIVKKRFPLNLSSIKGINKEMVCYMDYLNRGIHEYGQHKIVLDYEKIRNMLIASGFEEDKIKQSSFDESIDLMIRDYSSFYVLATK